MARSTQPPSLKVFSEPGPRGRTSSKKQDSLFSRTLFPLLPLLWHLRPEHVATWVVPLVVQTSWGGSQCPTSCQHLWLVFATNCHRRRGRVPSTSQQSRRGSCWVKTTKANCFSCSLPSGFCCGVYLRTPLFGGAVPCSPRIGRKRAAWRWVRAASSIRFHHFDCQSIPGMCWSPAAWYGKLRDSVSAKGGGISRVADSQTSWPGATTQGTW